MKWICLLKRQNKNKNKKREQRQSFFLTLGHPAQSSLTQTSAKGLDCRLPFPRLSPPHPPMMVAKLMTFSRLPGTMLLGCSLRRALVSAAWGRGRVILGRLVRCSPCRICCLASSRTRVRSPWGASVDPPQDGHADLVLCTHTNAHNSTGQSWTFESPMLQGRWL